MSLTNQHTEGDSPTSPSRYEKSRGLNDSDYGEGRQELASLNPAKAVEADQLPKGYYWSPRFLGSFCAISINLMASTGGFAYVAPAITYINMSVGPGQTVWLSVVYAMMSAVSVTLVGQLSDIFGRRYFWIGGTALGAVGALISSQAQSVSVVIGGQTLIGLSACTGLSYSFLLGELVPMKHRFLVNAFAYIPVFASAGFGAVVSTSFVLYTDVGWRGPYYLLIGANGTASLLYFLFYYPPNFYHKHTSEKLMTFVKNYDYVGMLLYISGLVLFLLGLLWGGNVYPWKSAAVISSMVIGGVLLILLFVYEAFLAPREPLIPTHLFKDRHWVAAALTLSLGAATYYSMALVWPQMATSVYSNGDMLWAGWVGSLAGVGCNFGEILGSFGARAIGKTKYQSVVSMTVGTVLLASMAACTPDTPELAIGLMFVGVTAIGYVEALALPIINIVIKDQTQVGTASGVAGAMRSTISAIAQTIFTVVLTTRAAHTISSQVPPALIGAGLPLSSVEEYMTAVAAGGTAVVLGQIAGVDSQVMARGARAYQEAYADAFCTVFYTSLLFGCLGIIATTLIPNVEAYLTDEVTIRLRQGGLKRGGKADVATSV